MIIIHKSPGMETTLASVDEWVKEMSHTHTQKYAQWLEKEILPFVTTEMDYEGIILRDMSLTEKDKYHMISLTCGMWNTQRTSCSCQRRWGGGWVKWGREEGPKTQISHGM